MAKTGTAIDGQESPEMYLKTIYTLNREKGYCHSVDVAEKLQVSKPSVSVAVRKLKEKDYLYVRDDGVLILTDKGEGRAKIICEKCEFWTTVLQHLGLDEARANEEACKFEHALSDEAYDLIIQHNRSAKGVCRHTDRKVDGSPDCTKCEVVPWRPCEEST